MEIIICGDSFCSANKHHRNHFSQILEDTYGYSVINLARGGASAINIGYQIQTAIELKPDIVIYARTKFPRLDIRASTKHFKPTVGLKNFAYTNPSEASFYSPYVGDKTAPIFSNNYGSLISAPLFNEKLFLKIPKEKQTAVEQFYLHLYDENLSADTYQWIYEYWEFKLVKHNIEYIPFNNIGKEAIVFSQTNPDYPEIYHTDFETQKIVAKNAHHFIEIFKDNG